jgi:hypothetical protein
MKNLPELRFDGFDGEWEEKKLSNIVKVNSGRDYKHLSEGKYPVYGTGGLMTYVNEFLSDEDSVGIGRKGTINKPQKLESPFWTVDTLFYATPIKDYNLDYIYCIFQRINWLKYDESTGLPSLSKSNINNIRIFNAGVHEQEKIGNLFKKIDALIEIQEGKVSKMEDFKKSLVQKMFPKKDELVPEFRFDGFDSNWSVSRLGEVTSLRGGYAFKSQNYIENGIPILRISNINSNGTTNEDYVYYTEILNDDNISLDNDAIVIAMSGATTGKISILKTQGKVYQNQRVGYFTKSDRVDYSYLSVILRSRLFTSQLDKILIAGAQPNISSKDVEDFSFKFPSLEEQEKIGNFFKNLDTQIENEERLLDSYKMMKKSLLQKMFV